MELSKVDKVVNWKIPTNQDLLWGFLGSVGYVVDDVASVRLLMGLLHGLTSFHTHQCAFDQVKAEVEQFRNNHRVPLRYRQKEALINLVTNAS